MTYAWIIIRRIPSHRALLGNDADDIFVRKSPLNTNDCTKPLPKKFSVAFSYFEYTIPVAVTWSQWLICMEISFLIGQICCSISEPGTSGHLQVCKVIGWALFRSIRETSQKPLQTSQKFSGH